MRGLEPQPGTSASPVLKGHHCPIGGGVWTQGAETEALRVGSKLVPFSLSVHSPAWKDTSTVVESSDLPH